MPSSDLADVVGRPMRTLAGLLVVIALPSALLHSSAGGTVFYLLAILGLVLALRAPAQTLQDLRHVPELWQATLLLVGLNLASVLAHGLPARSFTLTPLLMMPLVALIPLSGLVGPKQLYLGSALGAATAGAISLTDRLVTEAARPSGMLNEIVFPQIALLCALFALAGLFQASGRRASLTWLLAISAGVAATVAAGARGVLLGLPLLVAACWRWPAAPGAAAQRNAKAHRRLLIAVALAMVLAVGAVGHRLDLDGRMRLAVEEVEAWRSGDVGMRSVAVRLALWQAAFEMTEAHPVFGVGASRFRPELAELQQAGRFPADTVVYSHAHSLPLNTLAEYGLVGLAVLALAGWLCWRALRHCPPDLRRVGRASLLLWLMFGLTNDLFAHQNTLRVIAFSLALCAGMGAAAALRPACGSENRCSARTGADGGT